MTTFRFTFAVLVMSFGLRMWLVVNGGAEFFPDEGRMARAEDFMALGEEGKWGEAWGRLLGHTDHALLGVAFLPAAGLARALPQVDWAAGLYFALISTLVVGQIGRVARAAGAGEREYRWVLGLAAGANSLMYFSRHYLPYDAALLVQLAGVEAALRSPRCGAWGGGAAAALGAVVYNGYWLTGGLVLFLPLLHRWLQNEGWAAVGSAAWRAAGGAAVAMVIVVGLIFAVAGGEAVSFWRHAATITQGDFGQGGWLVADYLWRTESGLLALWVLAAAAPWFWGGARPARWNTWVVGLGGVLLGLVVLCDVVPVFVVYGRLARQAVPFLILAAGVGLAQLPRRGSLAVAVIAVVLPWVNWRVPLGQDFPREFLQEAEAWIAAQDDPGGYRTWNVDYLWGAELGAPRPPHRVLWSRPHPLSYAPYRLEGFDAAQRDALVGHDIAMKVVRVEVESWLADAGDPDGVTPYPGALRLRVRFSLEALGRTEPLVTTGTPGRGDFFFVRFEDSAHVRFGVDHWGVGEWLSERLPVDYDAEQEIVVSLASWWPPAYRGETQGGAERLIVWWNGEVLAAAPFPVHPTRPSEVTIGWNLIGGTTTSAQFSGELRAVERVSRSELRELVGDAGSR